MAASSSALAAVVPSALVAGPMTPLEALRACASNSQIMWPTGELNKYGVRAAAVLQQERLNTDRFGGFIVFNDGFNCSFRLFDTLHELGIVDAARVFPMTPVPSHGLK